MKSLFQTIYCIAISAIMFSCESSDPVPIDYSAELEQVAIEANLLPGETLTTIDLTRVFTKNEWDSIIVIKPYARYSNFKKLNLENNSDVRFILSEMQYIDYHYYLLFVKENEITAYSKLSNFYRVGVDGKGAFPIMHKSDPIVSLKRVKDDPNFYQFHRVSNLSEQDSVKVFGKEN